MNKLYRIALVLLMGALAAGCANQDIKPTTVLCPLLGGVLGAGIAAGGLGSDSSGALAGGAVVGAALGYFLCSEPAVAPAPTPAPRAAPAPAPKPMAAPMDSDHDGVIDANDKCPETSAGVTVNAEGCPEVGSTLMSLEGVNFDTASAHIKPESTGILDHAVETLNQNASVSVSVEGHTDNRGSDAYNKPLSEKRAAAVVDYLVSKGISAGRLTSAGFGEAAPVAPNDTAENMAKNRRVDLVVTKN